MVRKSVPPFRSERKKKSTSEGTPRFPNGTSGKLPYHLTSTEISGLSGQMLSIPCFYFHSFLDRCLTPFHHSTSFPGSFP